MERGKEGERERQKEGGRKEKKVGSENTFQVEVTVLYTLISEVAFRHLCHVHLIKGKSLGAAHNPEKEVT